MRSFTLQEMTSHARSLARNKEHIDLRRVRCVRQPCPAFPCTVNITHMHPQTKGALIVIDNYDLHAPKTHQRWMLGHEVAHIYTNARHGSKEFLATETVLAGGKSTFKKYWDRLERHAASRGRKRTLV